MPQFDPQQMILRMTAIVFIITVHEFCHAWAAWRLGDPTAKIMGRVTLNPLAHLEIFGTLMILFGPFGWGKPVPVNKDNFRHPNRDDVIVSFAGAGSSLALGIVFGLLLRATAHVAPAIASGTFVAQVWETTFGFLALSTLVGLGLGLFNLLPIFPLDGSHVLRGFIPSAFQPHYDRIQHKAPMILLAVLIIPWLTDKPFILDWTLWPILRHLFTLTTGLHL